MTSVINTVTITGEVERIFDLVTMRDFGRNGIRPLRRLAASPRDLTALAI